MNCSNLERSLSFYEKLGFEQVGAIQSRRVESSGTETAMIARRGTAFRSLRLRAKRHEHDTLIQLVEWEGTREGGNQGLSAAQSGVSRIVLVTAHFDELSQRLRTEGIAFAADPIDVPAHKTRMLWLRDPDGVLVELVEANQDLLLRANARLAMPEMW